MKHKHIHKAILSFVAAFAAMYAVSPNASAAGDETDHSPLVAVAKLQSAEGQNVLGVVIFVEAPDGVRVVGEISGLTPGLHGFHVHEKGDLSAPDLTSAGGHYNPAGAPHAGRDAQKRHVGDMGNIEANADGHASVDYIDEHLALSGEHSIVDRSIIVHGGKDDLKSQPSGAAGPRVAGGLIKLRE